MVSKKWRKYTFLRAFQCCTAASLARYRIVGDQSVGMSGILQPVAVGHGMHLRVKSAGSGLVRQPSGLPSIADISLRCRELAVWADSVEKVRSCEERFFSEALVRSWRIYVRVRMSTLTSYRRTS
jgi:hypothetical protein